MIRVKVSAKNMRLKFTPCGPPCIAKGCTGKCCDAPTHPLGCRVYVAQAEVAGIEAAGGKVVEGFVQPREAPGPCPFKTDGHLCGLYGSPARPFGCTASPFMLTKRDTLIVRNRYKLLPCYGGPLPAYVAYRSALEAIFYDAKGLFDHFSHGGGDVHWPMGAQQYNMLKGREGALAK